MMIDCKLINERVYYNFDGGYKNVTIQIKIDGVDNYLNNQTYEEVFENVNYYFEIPARIFKFCKNNIIFVCIIDGVAYEYRPKPTENNFNISIISNSCVGWRTYERLNMKYTSPTIGNLILDDLKYLKFCEMYDFYSKVDFTFGDIRDNEKYFNQYGKYYFKDWKYPISHHSDIDIHWIHNHTDEMIIHEDGGWTLRPDKEISELHFYNKWKERELRGRGKEQIFLWSASEFYNSHGKHERKVIVDRFKSLKGKSIFLTEIKDEEFEDENHIVKYIEEWEGLNQLQVGREGAEWNDQILNGLIFKEIIESKFL